MPKHNSKQPVKEHHHLKPGGARVKGNAAEREVINLLKPIVETVLGPLNTVVLRRNLEQTAKGGHDMLGLEWLALEVKRQETLTIDTWWKQTMMQSLKAGHDAIPVLLYRKSHQPWRAVLVGQIGTMPCRVQVEFEEFLAWFRNELSLRHSSDTAA